MRKMKLIRGSEEGKRKMRAQVSCKKCAWVDGEVEVEVL